MIILVIILVLSRNLLDVYMDSVVFNSSDSAEPSVFEEKDENVFNGVASLFTWKTSNLLSFNEVNEKDSGNFKVTVRVNNETPLDKQSQTKNKSDETRILGGYRIRIQRAPSYVVIFYKGVQICTGNLISRRHVLTAAHCVTDLNLKARTAPNFCKLRAKYFTVRAGSSHSETGGQFVHGWLVDIHPEYLTVPSKVNLFRDIAVIKLWNEVNLGTTTKISNIHPRLKEGELSSIGGLKCMVSGWGSNRYQGSLSKHLKQTTVTMLDMDICMNKYYKGVNSTVQLCALDPNTDTCQGDSGAALLCNGSILAVTSWGFRCGDGMPAVYARVDNANDFIRKALSSSSPRNTYVIVKLFFTVHILNYSYQLF